VARTKNGIYNHWGKSNKIERVFLLAAINFSIVVRILTWYGVRFEGLNEESVGSLMLMKAYGLDLALFLNALTIVLFLTLLWMTWIHYRIEKQKHNPSETLYKGFF